MLGSNHFNASDGDDTGRRYKHSERQINRLFRKHPARARVDARLGIERQKPPPESLEETKPTYEAVHDAKLLPNGWSKPPPDDFQRPEYPFSLSRTKNKPNNAIGFLPVYAKFRYVSFCLFHVPFHLRKISHFSVFIINSLFIVLDCCITERMGPRL